MSSKATTLDTVKSVIAEDLVKTYDGGKVRALDGLTLDVSEGTVLGVLGPNGAGKTTTVRVLTTLLIPDSGRAIYDLHEKFHYSIYNQKS